jgi:anti-sigma B factor antagonist
MASQPLGRHLLQIDDEARRRKAMRRSERRNRAATHSPNGFPRSALAVAELREGSTVRLHLEGELDMATRPQVERALLRAEDSGAAVIELDLSGLTFMDSSGLHIALEARDRALQKGHSLVLLEGAESVQRIFELTATEQLFRFRKELREPS